MNKFELNIRFRHPKKIDLKYTCICAKYLMLKKINRFNPQRRSKGDRQGVDIKFHYANRGNR